MAPDDDFKSPDKRRLLIATGVAFLVALLLLVTVVMPAEYGIDRTGVGSLLGINGVSGGGTEPASTTNSTVLNLSAYSAAWPAATKNLEAQAGDLDEGDEANVTFTIDTPNVTTVRATLTWTDDDESATGDPTQPDLFELTIHAPDGTSSRAFLGRNDVGQEGRLVADLAFRPAPRPLTIQATDPASAYFQFLDAVAPDFDGVGDWNVTVRMVEAGDADAGGVPLGTASPDEGNDWSLAFEFDAFSLDAGELAAQAVRHETVNVTVPAGQGLEYKLFVNEGANVTYNWTATGELFFDFHGERAGDMSGDFTSHKTGTSRADAGNFTAPFTGTHGWYWENRSDSQVTVTLTTRGLYSVVGVV